MKSSTEVRTYEMLRNCDSLKMGEEITLISQEQGIRFFTHARIVGLEAGFIRLEVNTNAHTIGTGEGQKNAILLPVGHKESREEIEEANSRNYAVLRH